MEQSETGFWKDTHGPACYPSEVWLPSPKYCLEADHTDLLKWSHIVKRTRLVSINGSRHICWLSQSDKTQRKHFWQLLTLRLLRAGKHHIPNDSDAIQATVYSSRWSHRFAEDVCNSLCAWDCRWGGSDLWWQSFNTDRHGKDNWNVSPVSERVAMLLWIWTGTDWAKDV